MSARPGPFAGVLQEMATRSLRAFAQTVVARKLVVDAEGLEHLPADGPVVIAARHYHHLHDATVLLSMIARPVQILVALDWVRRPWGRRLMEWACHTARWPFVLRRDSPHLHGATAGSAYHPDEAFGVARRAVHKVTALLAEGRVLLVFPEAYPVVDPEGAYRSDDDRLLPFRPGFARLVARAQRLTGASVPVLPVGFQYRPGQRWHVTVRFGPAVYLRQGDDLPAFVRAVEADVRALSGVAQTPEPARYS